MLVGCNAVFSRVDANTQSLMGICITPVKLLFKFVAKKGACKCHNPNFSQCAAYWPEAQVAAFTTILFCNIKEGVTFILILVMNAAENLMVAAWITSIVVQQHQAYISQCLKLPLPDMMLPI
jgi:hypothetical protein